MKNQLNRPWLLGSAKSTVFFLFSCSPGLTSMMKTPVWCKIRVDIQIVWTCKLGLPGTFNKVRLVMENKRKLLEIFDEWLYAALRRCWGSELILIKQQQSADSSLGLQWLYCFSYIPVFLSFPSIFYFLIAFACCCNAEGSFIISEDVKTSLLVFALAIHYSFDLHHVRSCMFTEF